MDAALKLRAYLLPKTLEHAVHNSPFYAQRFESLEGGHSWQDVSGPEDLPMLPLLEKSECVAHQDDMRCGEAPTDFGSISSGTTRVGKELFRVERSNEEALALDEFYEMVGHKKADAGDQNAPLILHVLTPNHGLPQNASPTNTLRISWASSRNVCDIILQALRTPIGGKRISVMRVSVSILKQLTVFFQQEGVDFSEFALTEIGTYAALVSPRWRKIFESVWGAKVFDNYSLSEFKTPATECETCGWYHFSEPPLIPEFLDPITNLPTNEKIAHLVLTGLYPYVQRTPLIRYASNDLVLRGPPCDGHESLRFLGRRHQALYDEHEGKTRYLLFPAWVENIVDDYPEVARHLHPMEQVEKLPRYSVGLPKYQVRFDEGVVRVIVGTTFSPALFVERAHALKEELSQRVLSLHSELKESDVSLDIELKYALNNDDWNEWIVKYLA